MNQRELVSQLIDSAAFRDMVVDKLYEIVARDVASLEIAPGDDKSCKPFVDKRREYCQVLVALAGNVNSRLATQSGIGGYIRFASKNIAPGIDGASYENLPNDGSDPAVIAFCEGIADDDTIKIEVGKICDSSVNLIAGILPSEVAVAVSEGVWVDPS